MSSKNGQRTITSFFKKSGAPGTPPSKSDSRKRTSSSPPPSSSNASKSIPQVLSPAVKKKPVDDVHLLESSPNPTKPSNTPTSSSKPSFTTLEIEQRLALAELISRPSPFDTVPLWSPGSPTPYLAVAAAFEAIDSTTKRLEKIDYLAILYEIIMLLSPQDYHKVLYLCVNELGPPHLGIVLGLGDAILIDAIAQTTGKSASQVKEEAKKVGDLGDVAVASRQRQKTLIKPKPLTVPFVFNELMKVAKMEGHRSRRDKTSIVANLLACCQGSEAKFIVRSLQGRIRIGASEATVTSSVAKAAVRFESKMIGSSDGSDDELYIDAEPIIKQAHAEVNDLGQLAEAIIKHGWRRVSQECSFRVGYPVKPMLAKPTKSVSEVLTRFEKDKSSFTCEYKYDGERAQIHFLPDTSVKIYSRNCEDMTVKYPDLVEIMTNLTGSRDGLVVKEGVESFVIDCEVVAYNRVTNKVESFQKLSTRARKDVTTENIEVNVCLFAFDCIYLNGQSLLHEPFITRRKFLHENFIEIQGKFHFAVFENCSSVEDISAFLDEAVNNGTEGLMVKTLDQNSEYCPARRSYKWLKVKKDYINELGDSLDLVPIAAYLGKGKRLGVYASYIVAIYDTENEIFQAVSKVGTGFSDQIFAEFTKFFDEFKQTTPPNDVQYGNIETPDVYFDPFKHKTVWEVKVADLFLSPIYPSAKGAVADRGIGVRFPRFIRVRDDKGPELATDTQQLVGFYRAQGSVGSKNDDDFDDDFF
ncbi:hypothetical protein RCL1_005030 [Eukaryota sp. TZLM3-RCL]